MNSESNRKFMRRHLDWIRDSSNKDKTEVDFDTTQLYSHSIDLELRNVISKWLICTPFKSFVKEIEKRVQGQPNLSMILFIVYHYLCCIAHKQPTENMNALLAGTSGCGKTETYRALKAYFANAIPNLVIDIVDMTKITTSGFVGSDPKLIVSGLKRRDSSGFGIVFLDELDKIIIPLHNSEGDNYNKQIQGHLLKTIEGYNIDGVDSAKTLFIGMGSFNEIRDQRDSIKHIGFSVERTETISDYYSEITREDLIELGACYELVGRFNQIINYKNLSAEAVDKIIDLRISELERSYNIKISIGAEMRSYLHANSNSRFGNRLLLSILRDAVSRAEVEILFGDLNADEILITSKNDYVIRMAGEELCKSVGQMGSLI